MRRVMPLIAAALAGLGVLASTSLAGAGSASSCTPQHSVGATSFDYVLCGLPDLDQIRENTPSHQGLPGDGYAFCVPTSTMDALSWFASHGAPSLRPGNKDWTLASNYDEMTADIADLGNLMGTTASGGTTTGYQAGIDQWLAEHASGVPLPSLPLVPSYLWVTAPNTYVFAPTLREMAEDGAAGSIVMPNIVFAKYEKPPSPQTGPKQWYQVGGHLTAMSSAKSPSTIGWHDPYLPTVDDTVQSPYSEETYTLKPVNSTFGYQDPTTGKNDNFPATLLEVKGYSVDAVFGTGVQGFVWGYSVLSPETLTGWKLGKITQVAPVKAGDPVESFFSAGRRAVIDLALDPTGPRAFYTERGSDTVWLLDTANGRSVPVDSGGEQPELLAYAGRTRSLFVVGTRTLAVLGQSRTKVTKVQTPTGEHVDALTVDQEDSRFLALSAESGHLRVYDAQLRALATIQLPAAALRGTGRLSMTLRGDLLYVHRDGRPGFAMFTLRGGKLGGSRFVRLQGAVRPTGLAVDDAGNVFVTSAAKLAEFGPNGKPISSGFTGKVAGDALVVNRTFSDAPFKSLPFRDSPLPRRR